MALEPVIKGETPSDSDLCATCLIGVDPPGYGHEVRHELSECVRNLVEKLKELEKRINEQE